MTLVTAAVHKGLALVYDTEDVESIELATPFDAVDVTEPGDTGTRLKVGQAHLSLRVDFLPGKRALWVEQGGQ